MLDLSTLDLKGKILVVNVPEGEEADAAEMLSEAHESLTEAGCTFSIILTPDVTISSIDEEEMAEHGWVRVAASE